MNDSRNDPRKPKLTTADVADSTRQAERDRERSDDDGMRQDPMQDPNRPMMRDDMRSDMRDMQNTRNQQGQPMPNRPQPPGPRHDGDPAMALFGEDEVRDMQAHWNDIQTNFVDEPRQAVQQADSLVASTIQRLAESFANGRAQLEKQWQRGQDVSTEDLRIALQRYRSFFHRLLAM